MSAFAYLSSQEVFGAYQYIISTAALVGILTLPGLNQALVRAVAQGKEATFHTVVSLRARGAVIMMLALLVVAGYYAFNENSALSLSFAIAAFLIPIMRVSETFLPLWQGRSRWREYAAYESISNALPALLFIPALFLTQNLVAVIAVYLIVYTAVRGVLFLVTRNTVKGKIHDKQANRFGAHLSLMHFFQMGAEQLDRIILWHIAGPAAVAVYSFAFLPTQRIRGFFPVDILALPKMSTLQEGHPKKRVLRAFFVLLLLILCVGVLAAVSAPIIYPFFFPGYSESILYFQVLLMTLLIVPFVFLETKLVALSQTRRLYITRSAPLALRLLLYIFLAPLFGIWGIIAATLIATILYGILVLVFFAWS